VEQARHDAELGRRIGERLSGVPGVSRIETAPDTGSVLVLFEPSRFDEEHLASAAREADLFHLDLSPTVTGEGLPPDGLLRGVWQRANAAVNQRSRGPFDLRTLVPLALVVWAVRQILTEPRLARTPWYTLLWYAWGIYTRFTPPTHYRPSPAARDEPRPD
jgi:hypothetical protein